MVSKYDLQVKSVNSEISRYCRKTVELAAIKEIVNALSDKLQQHERLLKEEYNQLDTLNYTVWRKENTFCDDIWVFAARHPPGRIFNRKTPKTGSAQRATLSGIQNEIDSIKNDIRLICTEESAEIAIANALDALDDMQIFSERIKNLLRQLHISKQGSKRRKEVADCLKKGNLIGNRKQRINKCNCVLKNSPCTRGRDKEFEKKGKTCLRWNLLVSAHTKSACNVDTEKRLNFAVKKRSNVSLKFERKRRCLK
ncbi:hypothetical protein KM043_003069 [Ampulex compressa]|nr:hypothetical protein KM043_003069 [Ampulex compressa]